MSLFFNDNYGIYGPKALTEDQYTTLVQQLHIVAQTVDPSLTLRVGYLEQSRLNEILPQLANLQSRVTVIEAWNQSANIPEMQNTINTISQFLNTEVPQIRQQVQQAVQNSNQATTTANSFQTIIIALQNEQSQQAQLIQAFQNAIQTFETQISQLQTNVQGIQGTLATHQQSIGSLTSRANQTETRLEEIAQTQQNHQQNLTTLSTQTSSLQSSVSSLTTQVENQSSQISNLTGRTTALEVLTNNFQQSLINTQSSISNLETTVSSQSGTIGSLQTQMTVTNDQITSLVTTTNGLSSQIATMNERVSNLEERIEEEESTSEALNNQVTTLSTTVNTLQGTTNALIAQTANLNQSVLALEDITTTQTSNINSLQTNLWNAQTSIQQIESQIPFFVRSNVTNTFVYPQNMTFPNIGVRPISKEVVLRTVNFSGTLSLTRIPLNPNPLYNWGIYRETYDVDTGITKGEHYYQYMFGIHLNGSSWFSTGIYANLSRISVSGTGGTPISSYSGLRTAFSNGNLASVSSTGFFNTTVRCLFLDFPWYTAYVFPPVVTLNMDVIQYANASSTTPITETSFPIKSYVWEWSPVHPQSPLLRATIFVYTPNLAVDNSRQISIIRINIKAEGAVSL